jgi:hypothetical protein
MCLRFFENGGTFFLALSKILLNQIPCMENATIDRHIDKWNEQLKFVNWDVKKCHKGYEFKSLPIKL